MSDTLPARWYNNEKDWFPGEYFVYIKMSYDPETGIYYVLDQVTSHKPLDNLK